jgi:hypothetical protein
MPAPKPSAHGSSLNNSSLSKAETTVTVTTVVAVTAPTTPETADLNPAAGGTISIARPSGASQRLAEA